MPEHITIPLNLLLEFIETEGMYVALQEAGVDNWPGFDYAMEDFDLEQYKSERLASIIDQ